MWTTRDEFRDTKRKGQRDEAKTIQRVEAQMSNSRNRSVGVIKVSANNVDQN
jgi:hypothetical protein